MGNLLTIDDVAARLRQDLQEKKHVLLFAHNGTGKTRLSMAFKDAWKKGNEKAGKDTLYFNAFTEDLFNWDNDLEEDGNCILEINNRSQFFSGLEDFEMDTRIRQALSRYADFDFDIEYEFDNFIKKQKISKIRFSRETFEEGVAKSNENIKISRGEESLFIWCFFLAVVQLALDGDEAYNWVRYIYIDDPISSLDENNAIKIGHHLGQLLKENKREIKAVISTHHSLFFNVMFNELRRERCTPYFFSYSNKANSYQLRGTGDTPFFHHVVTLMELYQFAQKGELYTYHFNILRAILEKSASFHGYKKFSDLITFGKDDPEGILRARIINVLNHGNYSIYEPKVMSEENKSMFKKILETFLKKYTFNPEIFSQPESEEIA